MASSLEGNKILAAILAAGIIASGSGVVSRIIYSPDHLEESVYVVEAAATEAEAAPAEEAQPIGVLLASASVPDGEGVFKKCAACHDASNGGPHKIGPNLWNIVDRPIGGADGYSYSDALTGHGGVWDYDALSAFLDNPKEFAPGTKMSFAGIKKEGDRADLILYLHSLSDNPAPLPEGG